MNTANLLRNFVLPKNKTKNHITLTFIKDYATILFWPNKIGKPKSYCVRPLPSPIFAPIKITNKVTVATTVPHSIEINKYSHNHAKTNVQPLSHLSHYAYLLIHFPRNLSSTRPLVNSYTKIKKLFQVVY